MQPIRRWMPLPLLILAATGALAQEAGAAAEPAAAHNPGAFWDSILFGAEVGVVGMVAVFFGLVGIYIALMALKKVSELSQKKVIRQKGVAAPVKQPQISAEVAHAIALALFMDLRTFEEETAQEITIRKITRPYSPWWHSGKMRLMNEKLQMFRKW